MLTSSRIVISIAVVLGCGVALQAQTPTRKESNRTVLGEITLTGCVERADAVTGASSAAADVDSLSFVLIQASKGTAADAPARIATNSTSAPKAVPKGSVYRLDGDVKTLNPHVGHRVEVSGTVQAATATPAAAADTSPAIAPLMKVAHVKMVSETCAR